jgi:hypothetical protein
MKAGGLLSVQGFARNRKVFELENFDLNGIEPDFTGRDILDFL